MQLSNFIILVSTLIGCTMALPMPIIITRVHTADAVTVTETNYFTVTRSVPIVEVFISGDETSTTTLITLQTDISTEGKDLDAVRPLTTTYVASTSSDCSTTITATGTPTPAAPVVVTSVVSVTATETSIPETTVAAADTTTADPTTSTTSTTPVADPTTSTTPAADPTTSTTPAADPTTSSTTPAAEPTTSTTPVATSSSTSSTSTTSAVVTHPGAVVGLVGNTGNTVDASVVASATTTTSPVAVAAVQTTSSSSSSSSSTTTTSTTTSAVAVVDKAATTAAATTSSTAATTDSSAVSTVTPSGIVYSPYNDDGTCKDYASVNTDLDLIHSKGISIIRVYGNDCNYLTNVLPIAKSLGLKVNQGFWISDEGVDSIDSAVTELISVVSAETYGYGWDLFEYFTIGNEAIISDYCTVDDLISKISSVKTLLKAGGYTGQVTTSEPPVTFENHPVLCTGSEIDFVGINSHAYFDTYSSAATAGSFVAGQITLVEGYCPGLQVLVTETGYPSAGIQNGGNIPSSENQGIAIANLLAEVGSNMILLSTYNDYWKSAGPYGIEQSFGIIDIIV